MAIQGGDVVWRILGDDTHLNKTMKDVGKSMVKVGATMTAAGAAITGTLGTMVKGWMDYGDELAKASDRTGVAVESLARLKHAADQSGIGLGTVENALKRMSRTVDEARQGTASYVEAFDRLGISIEDLDNLDPEQMFLVLAEALHQVEDHTTKAALAQEIFGRGGVELLPMLKDGAAGIRALGIEAEALGLGMEDGAARSAEKLKDELANLGNAMKSIGLVIAPILEPVITRISEILRGIVDRIKGWMENNNKLVATITLVAGGIGVLLSVLGPAIAGLGGIAIIIGAVGVKAIAVAAAVGVALAGAFVLLRKHIATAFEWVRANWDRLSALFQVWGKILVNYMRIIGSAIDIVFTAIGAILGTFLDESGSFWGDLVLGAKDGGGDWLDVVTRWYKMIERLTSWAADNMGRFAEWVKRHWETISTAAWLAWKVWDMTTGNMIRAIATLVGWLRTLFEWAQKALAVLGFIPGGGGNTRAMRTTAITGASGRLNSAQRQSASASGDVSVGGVTVNVNAAAGSDGAQIARAIARELPRVLGEEMRLRAGQRGLAWGT